MSGDGIDFQPQYLSDYFPTATVICDSAGHEFIFDHDGQLRKLETSPDSDAVYKPSHYYILDGYEAIDLIQDRLEQTDLPPFAAYCYGNTLKYLLRAPNKGAFEDYQKGQVYLKWLIEAIKDL